MQKNRPIQIKAAILLLVFAFNIIVGFACGLGIDMGFNSHEPDKEKTVSKIHTHADGEMHSHGPETGKHSHPKKNQHNEGGCCSDGVVKLAQTEKSIPTATSITNPVFFTAFIATYYDSNISYPSQVGTSRKYFVRGHHPPIPDIRLAIQSFQI